MAALGVDTFIEVRPGHGLSGLIKRTVEGTKVLSAANAEGVAEVADALRAQTDGDAGKGDVAKGEDQGEVVVLPERFAVSPGHGRFYTRSSPSASTTSGRTWRPSDLLGDPATARRQHPRPQPVPRLGDGPSRLGRAGHPGQILLSLRPF